jgi:hypothetical protein
MGGMIMSVNQRTKKDDNGCKQSFLSRFFSGLMMLARRALSSIKRFFGYTSAAKTPQNNQVDHIVSPDKFPKSRKILDFDALLTKCDALTECEERYVVTLDYIMNITLEGSLQEKILRHIQ